MDIATVVQTTTEYANRLGRSLTPHSVGEAAGKATLTIKALTSAFADGFRKGFTPAD